MFASYFNEKITNMLIIYSVWKLIYARPCHWYCDHENKNLWIFMFINIKKDQTSEKLLLWWIYTRNWTCLVLMSVTGVFEPPPPHNDCCSNRIFFLKLKLGSGYCSCPLKILSWNKDRGALQQHLSCWNVNFCQNVRFLFFFTCGVAPGSNLLKCKSLQSKKGWNRESLTEGYFFACLLTWGETFGCVVCGA